MLPGSQQVTRLMIMDNPFQTIRQGLLNLIARKKEESGIWELVVGHTMDYTTTYSQINRQRII